MEGLISNLDVFVYMRQTSFNADLLFQKVVTSVKLPLSEKQKTDLKTFCSTYTSNLKRKWKSANSTLDNFKVKFADWLDSEIKWPDFVLINEETSNIVMDSEHSVSTSFCSVPTSSTSSASNVPRSVSVSTSTTPFRARKHFEDLSPL